MNARILIVTGSYPPMRCGIGDYSCNLAKALAADPEIHIGVLTSACVGKISNSVGIDFFPIIKKWNFAEILKFIKIIRSWKPDIVHIQYPTQGYGKGFLPWILPMVSFMMKKKIIQTWHEGYGRRNAPQLFLKSIVPGGLILVRPNFKENLHPLLRWALWDKKPVLIPNASVIPRIDLDEGQKNALRKQYLQGQQRLIVFFGFVYPHKGVELLFEIADPALDQIIVAGQIDENSSYSQKIKRIASSKSWLNKLTITGFLPAIEVAKLLTAADAVILPFRTGAGEWNTSIHGAVLSGAFVITTSLTKSGYDKKRNVYFAKVDDVQEMRSALVAYAGTRREYDVDIDVDEWRKIADEHCLLYKISLS
ncbi:MAG: glycosyltransferase [Candidatus Omnitrophica bacterium]|nr:glycosyltransferase [Candidatus Omnitrophota bacterium]